MLRVIRAGAGCAAAALVLLLAPGVATASDTTINFDDLAGGTVVTTQYSGLGITFDQNAQGVPDPRGRLVIQSVGAAEAHSGTQVGNIRTGVNEFPSGDVWGHFTTPRQHVSVFVGQDAVQLGVVFTLEAFDIAGHSIPGASQTVGVPGTQTVGTLVSVSAPSAEIYSFHLSSDSDFAVIDDLSFDSVSRPPGPDFGLSVSDANRRVSLTAGGTAGTTIGLARNIASTGRIGLSVSGLPPGVTATVDPNPATLPNSSPERVTFTASADAPAESEVPVTVTAQPLDGSAGSDSRSVQVLLTVQGTYQLRATGLEVTQGTQYLQIPTPGTDPTAPVPYTGVKLISSKPTYVRLYMDAVRAPLGGVPVTAQLYGFDDDGRPLPGSPLGGSATAQDVGSPQLTPLQRTAGWDTITFGPLPPTWTQGGVRRLRAVISPPPPPLAGSAPPDYIECTTADCQQRLALEVSGVRFYQSFGGFGITVVNLHVNGIPDPPDNPYRYMGWARQLSPVQIIPEGPEATIDITDIWNEDTWSNDDRNDKSDDVISLLEDWSEDNPEGSAVMGVANQDGARHDLGMEQGGPIGSGDKPLMVVNFNRQFTSVAHELGHAFGRQHASPGCLGGANGQQAEDWPPDEQGLIDGVGMNIGAFGPSPLPSGQLYDFMSYCAGERNSWISPRGWDEVMNTAAPYLGRAGVVATAPPGVIRATPASAKHMLRVIVISDSSGTRITDVQPGSLNHASAQLPQTSFHLLVKNRAGKTVGRGVLRAHLEGHTDGPGGRPFVLMLGQVPAGGAQTIAVSSAGKVVATRRRPVDRLAIRLLSPRPRTRLGRSKTITVRWRTRATRKLRREATIEFSPDGRTWRPLWMGPDRGKATVRSVGLPRSRRARIRVLVNDGFNQAQVVSGRLISGA